MAEHLEKLLFRGLGVLKLVKKLRLLVEKFLTFLDFPDDQSRKALENFPFPPGQSLGPRTCIHHTKRARTEP